MGTIQEKKIRIQEKIRIIKAAVLRDPMLPYSRHGLPYGAHVRANGRQLIVRFYPPDTDHPETFTMYIPDRGTRKVKVNL